MNLLFGQAVVFEGTDHAHVDGAKVGHYIFYGETLDKEAIPILQAKAEEYEAVLLPREEFVKKVFLSRSLGVGHSMRCLQPTL